MSNYKFLIGSGSTVKDLYDDYGFRVTDAIGIGMPAHENRFSRYAALDGAAFDATYIPERVITLVGFFVGSSLSDLHAKRKALIQAINRDATQAAPVISPTSTANIAKFTGEFVFRYDGSGGNRDIRVRYDGGLEVEKFYVGKFEKAAIRLIALDPIFRSASYSSTNVTTLATVANVNNIIVRSHLGEYAELVTGAAGGSVYAMAVDAVHGDLYVGGTFTSMGGVANTQFIARFDIADGTWHAVGAGLAGTGVYALAYNGGLYVGGKFNAPTAGSANITFRNAADSAWLPLGQGVSGGDATVWCIHPSRGAQGGYGKGIYVGGSFTQAVTAAGANVANTTNIALWNGSAWGAALGSATGSTDGAVYAITSDRRGIVFVGGYFKNIHGVAANGFAYYAPGSVPGFAIDTLTTTGTATGADANSVVRSMCLAPDGSVMVGGTFTSMNSIANTVRVARWIGASSASATFQPLASGLGDSTIATSSMVRFLKYEPISGELWAVTNGLTLNPNTVTSPVARYVDGRWLPADFTVGENKLTVLDFWPLTDSSYGLGKVTTTYIGADFTGASGTVNAPYSNIVDASASATARMYPVFTITRSGGTSYQLRGIHNRATGAEIHLIYDLEDGETITVNLEPGQKTVTSSFYGNVLHEVLPGSDLTSFWMEPSASLISIHAVGVGSPTITATMKYRPAFWSCD